MQEIITAWPRLIPFGILFLLAAILAFALFIFIERPNAEGPALVHWKSRVRRTALSTLRRHRFDLVFGISLGAAVTVISGLLLSPSAAAAYSWKCFVVLLQIAPFYLADMLTGNTHEDGSGRTIIFWLLVFVQWFIVGLTFSSLIRIKK